MQRITAKQLLAAEQFLWLSARVLERVRFEHLFRSGPREPVLHALAAYQNLDGGYGQAIEPDFRGPVSQPLSVLFALGVLDELGGPDTPQLSRLLAYVSSITAADGGVPNVLANATQYPRAPWWTPEPEQPGSLLPTASIAGLLYKLRIAHAWLERATTFCWQALGPLQERAARSGDRIARMHTLYEARAAVTFLEHVPDRERAREAATALGEVLRKHGLIATREREQMAAPELAEAASALNFATGPDALARRWFDDAIIERNLDELVESQAADGGFDVPWLVWTPITQLEWRGVLTVERLKVLRAYNRVVR